MNFSAIRYRAIEKISSPVLTAMARRNMPRAAAVFVGAHMETQQRASAAKPVNIVYLPKAGHTEDIMACFKDQDRYGIHTLDRKLVKAVYAAFLPREMDDNNYRSSDPEVEATKMRLRAFWVEVLKYLHPAMGFDVMFTGNFSYASEQELAGACTQVGIPFIALHKECLKTPGLEPFYTHVYQTRKGPFNGAAVCSYNNVEANIQKQTPVTDAEKILVTGMPRLDRLHTIQKQGQADKADPAQPLVVFFAINTKAGLPMIGRKIPGSFETLSRDLERLSTEKLAEDNYMAMLELARENPNIKVVIKTKGDVNSGRMIDRFYGDNPSLPPNLEIMAGGDLMDVMLRANVVTSFNSTTLFEALALNKPIVIPYFQEAADPDLAPYVLDMDEAVTYARSKAEFIALLKEKAFSSPEIRPGKALDPKAEQLLDKWLGNPDGLAGKRVRDVLDTVLKEKGIN